MADIPEPYKRLVSSDEVESLRDLTKPRPLRPKGVIIGEKRVRPGHLWFGFAFFAFLLFLGVLLLMYPPYSSHEISIQGTLRPQYYYHPSFNMSKGEKLIIQGYVKGGNDDIWIYIKSGSKTVKSFGKVESPIELSFTAPNDGIYTLYIDNSISLVTSKYVDLKIIHEYYDYSWGVILFLLGVGFVLFFLWRLIKGAKVLLVKAGDEIYEFMWSKVRGNKVGVCVKINGYELPKKLMPGEKFKIGPNDEHLLEIDLWHGKWFTTGISIKLDGQEIGRLP